MPPDFGQWISTCRTCTHPLARHAFEPGNLSLACQDPECECEGYVGVTEGAGGLWSQGMQRGTMRVDGWFTEPE